MAKTAFDASRIAALRGWEEDLASQALCPRRSHPMTTPATPVAAKGAETMSDKNLWHKRHHDFESFDQITFKIVPRYKTSGMSGDEWRQHVEVEFWFKGEVVHSARFRDMEAALMLAPGEWIKAQDPIPERVIDMERAGLCDQPSCASPSVGRLRIKEEFERGHKLHADESKWHIAYRQFCARHIKRGDCSREDSDDNYKPLDGKGADTSTNIEESPAAFGGVVVVDPSELP